MGLVQWQLRLLPLMTLLLLGLTVFFLWTSIAQLRGLQTHISTAPGLDIESDLQRLRPTPGDLPANSFEKIRWSTLIRLEANAMQRRYHQANTLLMARVWTIHLGFLTGMILSLVGAAFILGKMRESRSRFDVSHGDWKAAMESASPGLVLAVLGTALMITTIVARIDIQVNDRPLYVTDIGAIGSDVARALDPTSRPAEGGQSVQPQQRDVPRSQDEAANLERARAKLQRESADAAGGGARPGSSAPTPGAPGQR